jgi:drug/metabolite transporter (DMT)-like permease
MTETDIESRHKSQQYFGIGMVLLASVVIGLMPSAAKIAYQEGANPLALITLRCIVGMIVIGLYMLLNGKSFRINKSALRNTSYSGVAQALTSLGIMGALAYIDISVTVIIFSCFPFLIAIIEHYRGESRLTPFIFGCIVLALIGLSMALSLSLENLNSTGLILAVTGLVAVTIMILLMTRSSKQIGAIPANFFMTAWASVYFVLFALIVPLTGFVDVAIFPVSTKGWVAILITGITFSTSYVMFFVGASIIGTTRASILSISEPVMFILFAIMIVGEWLSVIQWLGVALVVSSLLMMEIRQSRN